MGSGQSTAEAGGFRVFKINEGSPATEAGLEVFFDFIMAINDSQMSEDQTNFFKKIQECENKRTKLVLHNIRTHASRDVFVTPRKWGGAGLLGAVVRYDLLESESHQGIRVLEVFPNSPAAEAHLLPYKDYLLGTTEVMFRDMEEVIELVNLCIGKRLQIYVYNSETESIREVTIAPRTGWGGEGAIGADIRTGLLHRIPAPKKGVNHVSQTPSDVSLSVASPGVTMPMPAAPFVDGVHLSTDSSPLSYRTLPPADHDSTMTVETFLAHPVPSQVAPTVLFPGALEPSVQPLWDTAPAAFPATCMPQAVVPVHPQAMALAPGTLSMEVQLESARRTLAAMEAALAAAAAQSQVHVNGNSLPLIPLFSPAPEPAVSPAAAPSAPEVPLPMEVQLENARRTLAIMEAAAPMPTRACTLVLDEALTPGVIYEIPAS